MTKVIYGNTTNTTLKLGGVNIPNLKTLSESQNTVKNINKT